MGSDRIVARRIAGVDITALPLTQLDAFVLSQVDGFADAHDIGAVTGQSDDECTAVLVRLRDLGAIEWEQVELPQERRDQIDELWAVLDHRNHYQLLGVARDAARAEIHKEYFLRSKIFHPDRVFGRKLGSYRKKMETIFTRLTDADRVLTHAKLRAEYDEELAARGDDRDGRMLPRAPRIDATPTGMHRAVLVVESGPVVVHPTEVDGDPAARAEVNEGRRRASAERLRRWLGRK
jgi:hypothetical protein